MSDYKALVCGSRNWSDYEAIEREIKKLPKNTLVIHGGASGADLIAGECAAEECLFVAEIRCEPWHWRKFGRSAGTHRNTVMLLLEPDIVIAFHKSNSSGTADTIRKAKKLGIPVEVHKG